MSGAAQISAVQGELVAEADDKFRAQAANAPLLDQKGKSALGACLARTMIAVNLDQFDDDRCRLEGFGEDIHRRSDSESSGAHLAAHQHVEAESSSLLRGNERNILRLTMRAVVHATRHRDVELARKVRELRIALAA